MYKRIKELRLERGLTQRQTAEALGVPAAAYARLERGGGGGRLRMTILMAMADFYGVSTDYILEFTDQREPHSRDSGGISTF